MKNNGETYHVIALENGQKPQDILVDTGKYVSKKCSLPTINVPISIVGIFLQQSILKLE